MKLYIAMPAYSGSVRVETMMALVQETQLLNQLGIDVHVNVNAGDSILPRCRNMFVQDFANKKDFDEFFFIDDDIVWELGAIARLMKYKVDFVAGCYPKRADPITYPVRWLDESVVEPDPATGLIEVGGVPTGFMRLTRHCVESMLAKYWGDAYEEDGLDPPEAIALFDFVRYNGEYWGEDYVFCKKWRDMGGKIWLDPEIAFEHIGYKRFGGKVGDWLRTRNDEMTNVTKILPKIRVPAGKA